MVSIPAIRVRQWLSDWDRIPVNEETFQSAPPHEFFVASIKAADLRALSGVYQRNASSGSPRAQDPYIQRTLEHDRTAEIRRYLKTGYPLSAMGDRKMGPEERASLSKPGWLPTAIVANIIPAAAERDGKPLAQSDSMTVRFSDAESSIVALEFPESWVAHGWAPTSAGPPPLEIIDGQHRLSAFDDNSDPDFELPIVVFSGLDFSWQAYLFWTINIKPKRINASLAYDLYPLLREQDWLEAGEQLNVYRETRSQEIVELLWSSPRSIWFDRINMLGQPGMRAKRPVTQASFIRSLSTTFVRPFKGHYGLGGLFGGSSENSGLNWPRPQQAAFVIFAWNSIGKAIAQSNFEWALDLRATEGTPLSLDLAGGSNDPAVVGDKSLLASDQGVRGFHMVVNDLAYLATEDIDLKVWSVAEVVDDDPSQQIDGLLSELEANQVGHFVSELAEGLAAYDWRNSQAPSLTAAEKDSKLALRGAGGYNVLRDRLITFLADSELISPRVAEYAARVRIARDGS